MASAAASAMALRVKAKAFRSYLGILIADGKRDAVMAVVPPDTAALMRDPPLPGSWMDGRHMHDVVVAVDAIGGIAAVRELTRRGTADARKPYMSIVEGVLKLFGTSPATLFKRMNTLVGSLLEGVDFRYTPKSDRSGVMEVEWAIDYEMPTCEFVGLMPTFQTLLDACGSKGVVGMPERLGPNKARYSIQW
jgi:hypothetical protein